MTHVWIAAKDVDCLEVLMNYMFAHVWLCFYADIWFGQHKWLMYLIDI